MTEKLLKQLVQEQETTNLLLSLLVANTNPGANVEDVGRQLREALAEKEPKTLYEGLEVPPRGG